MKRSIKSIIALSLVMCMTLGMTIVAWATDYEVEGEYDTSSRETTSDDRYICTGDTTFNVSSDTNIGEIHGSGYSITISGSGTLTATTSTAGNAAIEADNITIQDAKVNASNTNTGNGPNTGIMGDTVTIVNSSVNASGSGKNGYGIQSWGEVNITDSTVTAEGTQEGILGEGGVNITKSDVTAKGTVAINGGDVKLTDCAIESGGYQESSVVIKKPVEVVPDNTPCDDKKEEEKKEEKKDDSSSSSSSSTPAATNDNTTTVDPVVQSVSATLTSSFSAPALGADVGVKLEEPGEAAQAEFIKAMPSGWAKGFAFSITNSGKTAFTAKKGKVSFNIPAQYKKAGRKFALMGIDKDGNVKIFNNLDASGDKLTVDLDIEGYQFEVIYTD